MKAALIELHAFPSIAYMSLLSRFDLVILETQENYNKRSFRNKYQLMTSSSVKTLSIPLKKGKHNQLPVLHTVISYDEKWQRQHWRTIMSNYGSSPFFPYYGETIKSLLSNTYDSLYHYNFTILIKLVELIGINTCLASTLQYDSGCGELEDIRNLITPRSVLLHRNYHQVFESKLGFISNLSVLDLLFAKGPETINFLNNIDLSCKL